MLTATFTAGRLLCRHVRDGLDKMKFQGLKFDYIESSGWLERDFTIKADRQTLEAILKSLREWADENGIDRDNSC